MRKPELFRRYFKFLLVFSSVFIFALPVFAGVSNFYKWTDDTGRVHFTDDPRKIPEKYRSGPAVKKFRGFPPPKSSGSPSSEDDRKQQGEEQPASNDPAQENESEVMQEALNFLKNDIARYQKYDDYIPQRRNAILLREEIVGALPEKEALAQKLEKAKSPVLKETRNFLKQSLLKDYETKAHEHPRRLIFASERIRLQGELPAKSDLVARLEAELNSKKGDSPASPEPQKKENSKSDAKQNKIESPDQAEEETSPPKRRRAGY